jgi:hypothetical protein
LGIGWSVIPMLSINVEFRNLSFDEYNDIALGNELKNSGIVLGVSVPFTL